MGLDKLAEKKRYHVFPIPLFLLALLCTDFYREEKREEERRNERRDSDRRDDKRDRRDSDYRRNDSRDRDSDYRRNDSRDRDSDYRRNDSRDRDSDYRRNDSRDSRDEWVYDKRDDRRRDDKESDYRKRSNVERTPRQDMTPSWKHKDTSLENRIIKTDRTPRSQKYSAALFAFFFSSYFIFTDCF